MCEKCVFLADGKIKKKNWAFFRVLYLKLFIRLEKKTENIFSCVNFRPFFHFFFVNDLMMRGQLLITKEKYNHSF